MMAAGLVLRAIPLSTLRQSGFYGPAGAGVTVNENTAMRFSAVFASIRVIAETRGSLPIHVFERKKSGKRALVSQHPVSIALSTQPNDDMTPMVWSETCTAHVLSWGNSPCEIVWGDRGELVSLIPRHPSLVTPYRNSNGELMFEVKPESQERPRNLDRSQMIWVPGLGGNGIVGWSPIRLAAESIGIGLGQDQMAAAYFGNKAKPGLVVTAPGSIEDTAYARLKNELDTQYQGSNAFRALLLENGLTAAPLTIPMNEAQFLESREFQGEEIACRWYRLPPHVVGFLRRATFSNIESQDLYFEKHTMRPWLIRFEQEMNRKLFSRNEWGRFYVKHNVDALLRADIKTRYEAYKSAILAGWKNRNEIRDMEDLNPVDGLDDYPLPEAIFGKSAQADGQPKEGTDDGKSGTANGQQAA
jgi:HK97 family phage portal protein